jgi:hypothetical protein
LVDERNLPFAPQYPLWTDGASKRRWIRLPQGTSIDASNPNDFAFPIGTRLWKQFGFERLVETRFMERRADGSWRFATYVWRAGGHDAELAPEAGVPWAHTMAEGVSYDVPGTTDCESCHLGRSNPVLGFGALQLSADRDTLAPHAEPPSDAILDLAAFASRGLIRNLPDERCAPKTIPKIKNRVPAPVPPKG